MDSETVKNDPYVFRLTFGNTITAPTTNLEELTLEQRVRREFKDANNEYYITLGGVKVNRKIYQPVEIEAELDIILKDVDHSSTKPTKVPSFDNVSALLLRRQVRVDLLQVGWSSKESLSLEDEKVYNIARNCYVYELNPQLKRDANGKKMYVKLNIFSMDKLLTLNKYSKAYVARKLGEGILQPEVLQFGTLSGDAPLVQTDVSGLRNLKYKDHNGEHEFIQPYLVQYNETFYEFLVRTSNRCGEFLYFEDGTLTLGLPDRGVPIIAKDYDSVTLQNSLPGPLDIDSHARDSAKDKTGILNKLNQTVIDKLSTGYPEDAFAGNTVSNMEQATDEYIFPLYKDKFSSLQREMFTSGNANDIAMFQAMKAGKTILSNTIDAYGGLAASLAVATIVDHGIQSYLSNNQQKSVNEEKNKLFLNPLKDNKEQSDGNRVVQFASLDEKGWTTIDYYKRIFKEEEEQQRKIVCIDMDTNFLFVKLGQKIIIEGLSGTYVVIQILQTTEEDWKRDYVKYGVDSNDRFSGRRSMKIFAIPSFMKDSKECFAPPVQPVPVIRKTGPQTAFVTANEDPKFQGRVRIAYPWQSEGGSRMKELKETEQKLKAAEDNVKKLEARRDAFLKLMTTSKNEVEELRKYLDATPEERQKMLDSLNKASVKMDPVIKTLEEKLAAMQKELTDYEKSEKKDDLDIDIANEYKKHMSDLEAQIAEKKAEKNHYQELADDMVAAAKEDEAKKGKDFNYKNVEKHNSIIKKYKDKCIDGSNQLREMSGDLNNAKKEKEAAEKNCLQKVNAVHEKMKEMSTPWIRVATPMATPGGGAFFRPRIGDEVLVNFDCDNIERPYVVGSLFSKNTLTPDERYYRKQSPELQWKDVSMAISSPNGHHISFTDPEKGGSFVTNLISPGLGFYGGIFGFNSIAGGGKDLAGGIHIGDRYGLYEIEMKSHKRSIDIRSPFGTVNINAFSGITISAPNGDVTIKGKNITLEAGNKITVNSGTNLPTPGFGDAPSKKTMTADIGKLIVEGVGAAVTDQFVSSVIDLSMVRHIIEVFVRPVDGTMQLKSRKFLKLEAGLGNATIKRDLYKKDTMNMLQKEQEFYKTLSERVESVNDELNMYLDGYLVAKKGFFRYRQDYHLMMDAVLKPDSKAPCISKMAMDDSKHHAQEPSFSIDTFIDLFKEKFILKGVEYEDNYKKYDAIKPLVTNYYRASRAFFEYCNGVMLAANIVNHEGDFGWLDSAFFKTATEGWTKKYFEEWHNKCDEVFETETVKVIVEENDPLSSHYQTHFRRCFLLAYLKNVYDAPENKEAGKAGKYIYIGYDVDKVTDPKHIDLSVDYWWKRQVAIIDRWSQMSWLRTLWDSTMAKLLGAVYDNTKGLINKETDRQVWNSDLNGQILFSDKENTTLSFEGEGLHKETDANEGNINHLKWILRDM